MNFPPAGWSPNLDGLFEGHCPLTEDMKEKVHLVFASLFTDRAISYRHDRGVWKLTETPKKGSCIAGFLQVNPTK